MVDLNDVVMGNGGGGRVMGLIGEGMRMVIGSGRKMLRREFKKFGPLVVVADFVCAKSNFYYIALECN